MRLLGLAAVPALLISMCAAHASEPESAAKEKVVCKNKIQTGTRFQSRSCRTAKEWEDMAEAAKRSAAEAINRPMVNLERSQ